ncbi:autoinducer binding domain-containing protein [Planktotalea sp.]|uniref:autoinducer binding domain-containing protein n=1 Tax=Planktotalea sp. TaxID=2029877 RepID=UPI003436F9AB
MVKFKGNAGLKDVFVNVRDFGITDRGLTVPIRGPYGECGLLSVMHDTTESGWVALKSNIFSTLQAAAVTMHDAVKSSDSLASVM